MSEEMINIIIGENEICTDWYLFLDTKINDISLPNYLEKLNMGKNFIEMDDIFIDNMNFVECFKIHMNLCSFRILYDFDRLSPV